uniref:Uncharacterized protein n=1 Tax=Arundo donax TaxID=35708 RepID=A0A0A9AMT1_ARUDO
MVHSNIKRQPQIQVRASTTKTKKPFVPSKLGLPYQKKKKIQSTWWAPRLPKVSTGLPQKVQCVGPHSAR